MAASQRNCWKCDRNSDFRRADPVVRQTRLLLILQSGTHPTRLSELAMSRATDGTALKRQSELGQTESVWWTLAVFGPERP